MIVDMIMSRQWAKSRRRDVRAMVAKGEEPPQWMLRVALCVMPDSKNGKRKWASKHAGKRWGQKRYKRGKASYRANWQHRQSKPALIYVTGNFSDGAYSIGYTTWDSRPLTWGEID